MIKILAVLLAPVSGLVGSSEVTRLETVILDTVADQAVAQCEPSFTFGGSKITIPNPKQRIKNWLFDLSPAMSPYKLSVPDAFGVERSIFVLDDVLGGGCASTVFKGFIDGPNKTFVACKPFFEFGNFGNKLVKTMFFLKDNAPLDSDEGLILEKIARANNTFMLQYFGSRQVGIFKWLFTEFLEGEPLSSGILPLSEQHTIQIGHQIAEQLNTLAKLNISHNDLLTKNLM